MVIYTDWYTFSPDLSTSSDKITKKSLKNVATSIREIFRHGGLRPPFKEDLTSVLHDVYDVIQRYPEVANEALGIYLTICEEGRKHPEFFENWSKQSEYGYLIQDFENDVNVNNSMLEKIKKYISSHKIALNKDTLVRLSRESYYHLPSKELAKTSKNLYTETVSVLRRNVFLDRHLWTNFNILNSLSANNPRALEWQMMGYSKLYFRNKNSWLQEGSQGFNERLQSLGDHTFSPIAEENILDDVLHYAQNSNVRASHNAQEIADHASALVGILHHSEGSLSQKEIDACGAMAAITTVNDGSILEALKQKPIDVSQEPNLDPIFSSLRADSEVFDWLHDVSAKDYGDGQAQYFTYLGRPKAVYTRIIARSMAENAHSSLAKAQRVAREFRRSIEANVLILKESSTLESQTAYYSRLSAGEILRATAALIQKTHEPDVVNEGLKTLTFAREMLQDVKTPQNQNDGFSNGFMELAQAVLMKMPENESVINAEVMSFKKNHPYTDYQSSRGELSSESHDNVIQFHTDVRKEEIKSRLVAQMMQQRRLSQKTNVIIEPQKAEQNVVDLKQHIQQRKQEINRRLRTTKPEDKISGVVIASKMAEGFANGTYQRPQTAEGYRYLSDKIKSDMLQQKGIKWVSAAMIRKAEFDKKIQQLKQAIKRRLRTTKPEDKISGVVIASKMAEGFVSGAYQRPQTAESYRYLADSIKSALLKQQGVEWTSAAMARKAEFDKQLSQRKQEIKRRLIGLHPEDRINGSVVASKIAEGFVSGAHQRPQNAEGFRELADSIREDLLKKRGIKWHPASTTGVQETTHEGSEVSSKNKPVSKQEENSKKEELAKYIAQRKKEIKRRMHSLKPEDRISGAVVADRIAVGIINDIIKTPKSREGFQELADGIKSRLLARRGISWSPVATQGATSEQVQQEQPVRPLNSADQVRYARAKGMREVVYEPGNQKAINLLHKIYLQVRGR